MYDNTASCVLLALASLTLAGATTAQATARVITPGMGTGISDDGIIVSGSGFLWTEATGRSNIGGSIALGRSLSADGTVVYGDFGSDAAIWKQATGWNNLPGLPGSTGCGGSLTSAYGISDDGSVATGLAWLGCVARAYRWTDATGTVALGLMGPRSARGNVVSGDGTVIGGWDEHSTGSRRAAVWYPNGTEVLLLENSPGNPIGSGEVWGMNDDASVITGHASPNAFRWTMTGGLQDLGPVPNAQSGGYGLSVTEDGGTVVGYTGSAFGVLTAFIWTEHDGMMRLDTYLQRQGIPGVSQIIFGVAAQITPDGTAICGWGGATPFNNMAFLVQMFTGVKYGFDKTAAHTLNLSGSGSSSLGGTFAATTTGAVSSSTVTLLSTNDAEIPTLGGVLLVDPNPTVIPVAANVPGEGTSSFSFSIPNVPALVGAPVYMQSLESAGTLRFSNGLRLIVRD